MCFSATASFVAAGVLSTAGVYGLSKSKTMAMRFYAVIPLLFGIQQGIEGWQWLYAGQGSTCQALGYSFLFFAFLVWPILIPTAIYLIEKKEQNRDRLRYFIYLGIAISTGLFVVLLSSPLNIIVNNHSFTYDIAIPLGAFSFLTYVFTVSGSPMLASRIRTRIFGLLILTSMILSWIFFSEALYSVWCYFSAIISLMIVTDPEIGKK